MDSSKQISSQRVLRRQTEAALRRALVRTFRDAVGRYEIERLACRENLTQGRVHRLRIAIRRLFAADAVLPVMKREAPEVLEILQRQLNALGLLRDAQIHGSFVRAQAQLGPARRVLLAHLRGCECRCRDEARRVLNPELSLAHLKHRPGGANETRPLFVGRLQRLVEASLQEAFDPLGGGEFAARADVPALHQSRISARKFRDLMESLPPDWRKRNTARLLLCLRPYLQVIGRIHDYDVLERRLETWAVGHVVSAATLQACRSALHAKRKMALSRCQRLEREVFHAAMLARRELRQALRGHE